MFTNIRSCTILWNPFMSRFKIFQVSETTSICWFIRFFVDRRFFANYDGRLVECCIKTKSEI